MLITAPPSEDAKPDPGLWSQSSSEVVRKLELIEALKPVIDRLSAESRDGGEAPRLKSAVEAVVGFIRSAVVRLDEKGVSVEKSDFFISRNGLNKIFCFLGFGICLDKIAIFPIVFKLLGSMFLTILSLKRRNSSEMTFSI